MRTSRRTFIRAGAGALGLALLRPRAGAADTTYTVVAGDTLWGIARAFGFDDWHPIYWANRGVIDDPDSLDIGAVLTIPDGATAAPAPAPDPAETPRSPVTGRPQAAGWVAYLRRTAPYPGWQYNIIMCESGGDAGATNRSSGAAGICQFLPSTARAFGRAYLGYAIDPYDWKQSIDLMNAMARAEPGGRLLAVHWDCA